MKTLILAKEAVKDHLSKMQSILFTYKAQSFDEIILDTLNVAFWL